MEQIELLLIIASLVAILSRRLRVPYTIGLVLAGVGLSLCGVQPSLHLSKDLIFTWLLPPLIFEAAFHLKWKELRPELPAALTLATLGVVLAATVAALLLVYFGGLSWHAAIIIGVTLSATDPVSVLALLKESSLPPKIHRLIESESLFNDGTAAVLFSLAPLILLGAATPQQFAVASCVAVFLGIAIGAAIGVVCLAIAGRTEDHLVEITVTMIAAFASFILAEHFHASGVLSTLTAGMLLGNLGHLGSITPKGREAADSFWEFAGFAANSIIFLLIGFDLAVWQQEGIRRIAFWTIVASVVGRAAAVYIGCIPLRLAKHAVPFKVQNLLFIGGLRGALALALVLGLPAETADRDLIVSAVFVAVAFSVVLQGLVAGRYISRQVST